MNNKYIKLFVVTITAFVVSMTVTNAKSFTKLEDLTKYIEKQEGSENIGWIYIVGEHIFTSTYSDELTLKNLSDGFQSIPKPTPTYIYLIERTYNGLTPSGWDIEGISNVFDAEDTDAMLLPEKINIKFVDNELIDTAANTDKDMNNIIKSANDATTVETATIKDAYEISNVSEGNVVTFNILKGDLIPDNFKGTTIAKSIYDLLHSDNDNDVVKYSEIKVSVEGQTPVSIKSDSNTKTIKEGILGLFNGIKNLGDLTGKSLNVEFVLAQDVENQVKSNTYTIKFVSIVDPNTYFEKLDNSTKAELSCTSTSDKQCEAIVNLLTPAENLDNNYAFVNLYNVINNAFKAGTKSVTLKIGENNTKVYNSTPTVQDINNILKIANIAKYEDLAKKENAISVTFVANTEKGYVFARENTQTYKFTIGEFVDTDKIVDKISAVNNKSNVGNTFDEATDYNKYYHLSRNNNQLTFDVNLQPNGKLYNFKQVVTGFATIIYGESEYSVIKKSENKISKIVIIDNNTQEEYELGINGDDIGKSLRTILATMLGTLDTGIINISPTMLSNLDFSIRFEINATKELIPGLNNYGVYTKGSQSATYDVSFKINHFDVKDMITNGFKNDSYLTIVDEDTTTDDNVYSLKVNLENVGTSLEEADLFNKLRCYAGLFNNLTMTVDETETSLNVNDLDALKETIDKLLKLDKTSTIEDLYEKTFTLKFELADDVNLSTFTDTEFKATADRKVGPYTINVTLTYDVKKVADGSSISEALSKKPEVIELTPNGTYGSDLTIGNDNDNTNDNIVINGNGATITGKVTVKANNVTFNNVNINGKLEVPGTGDTKVKDVTISGNGNTTITGAIDIENNANVTIDGMIIKGTNEDTDISSTTVSSVIKATGTGTFTLKNSKVSYIGGNIITGSDTSKQNYMYSLVYIDGDAEITDTTFDITNVKNPIEYKYNANEATKIVIDHNTFTGTNYVEGDAHNVISFYGAAKNAVIEVTNNTFAYANWAVRINNNTEKNPVTYIIRNNHVTRNTIDGNSDRNPLALIGVQANSKDDDLNNITIVYDENTAKDCVKYETDSKAFVKALESGKSALVYAYVSGGEVHFEATGKLPTLKTYEKYLEEQNKD